MGRPEEKLRGSSWIGDLGANQGTGLGAQASLPDWFPRALFFFKVQSAQDLVTAQSGSDTSEAGRDACAPGSVDRGTWDTTRKSALPETPNQTFIAHQFVIAPFSHASRNA
ncbi:MAG: hypothetical protein ABI923_04565, partial [bacterium]